MLFRTYTGKEIDLANIRPEDIDLVDIAHALSKLCRYGGHTTRHYSVAEHSLNVMDMVDPLYKREALMHDATEAYVGEMTAPLKRLLLEYTHIEMRVERVIAERFQLSLSPYVTPYPVKKADNIIRLYEMAELMPGCESLLDTAESVWSGLSPLPKWDDVENAFVAACKGLAIW